MELKSPVAVYYAHKTQPATPPPKNSAHNKRKLSMGSTAFVTPSPTPPQPSLSSLRVASASSFQQRQQTIPYVPYSYFLSPLQNQRNHIYYNTNYGHQHHHLGHSMSSYPNPQSFANTASAKDLYNRKRQRRQAAAAVVTSPFSFNSSNPDSTNSNNAMGRKSTAQPRPKLNVPPRGIGPIVDPNDNDVLCGRGGRINSHAGNVQFRDIIQSRKKEYLAPTTKKLEKAHIAAAIVNDIRGMDPPGRFLKEDRDTGLWFDIGDAKAIKKTGQALREDAPDIRPDLEGDDSSGDDKESHSLKKNEKKSPNAASPQAKQSPKQLPTTQVWPQGGNNANNNNPQMQAHEYQAQMAMPPPNNYPPQQQSQVQMPQQPPPHGFETRSIPIPAPSMRQVQQNFYTLPNQLYSGAQSVTSRVRSASKQAMAALSQAGPTVRSSALPPDDIAFGRPFHPPETHTVLSSDNTMSTISGLSENLSSNMSGGGFRPSALMNMSIRSSGVANRDSLQVSNLQGFARASGGRGHNSGGNEQSMGFSGLNGISLQRSLSLGSIMEGENWKAIMEAGDEILDEAAVKSILSGSSAKHSLNSGVRFGHRDSSAMSIGGLSMDLASNASSTQWLAAAGLGGLPHNMGDDHTAMSVMSANLDALDLASLDRYG